MPRDRILDPSLGGVGAWTALFIHSRMKVFVAGGSGAIGAQLVPQLVAAGHEVVVTTRGESKQPEIRALGASTVVADALDPDQVAPAVACSEPEVIVNQLTAITSVDPRHFDRISR